MQKKDEKDLPNSIKDAIFLLEEYRDFGPMQRFQTSFSLYHFSR